ncbi:RNA-directed DNA polymerase from mobile element jockey [Elysia marginata]|uniref:RNA-directed DNA polymerase from mobile element jockey n=1 Tax=Elysia marginata TaxID=1093978 RepID=A0AAV4JC22_9GAST|nr:RNA-directed DNA polymerase from mobile element jockey [Elysia marginata]
MEGKINGKRQRGRKRKSWLGNMEETTTRRINECCEVALNREEWRRTIASKLWQETEQRTLDEHAPLTKRTIPHRRYSPWFDDNIQVAKQERRSAERAWLKSGLQIHRQTFIAARKKVNNEVKNAKKRFYLAKFSTTKTCKKLFSLTDQLLGKTKHKQNGDKELCNKFSTFFD